MTLDDFRLAVNLGLTAHFGERVGKVMIVTDPIPVRHRWLVFVWIDGRAPLASIAFTSGSQEDEKERFPSFMRRVIVTLSHRPSREESGPG